MVRYIDRNFIIRTNLIIVFIKKIPLEKINLIDFTLNIAFGDSLTERFKHSSARLDVQRSDWLPGEELGFLVINKNTKKVL